MKIKRFIKENKYVLAFVFLIVCFALFMTLLFIKESDYFWHIKAGEYMWKNTLILKEDIFSWFLKGSYWMSHEWLFEVVLYGLKYLFGNIHLFIYSFFTILSLLLILFFTNKTEYLKNLLFSLVWLVIFLIFCVYIQARPHMISFSFVAVTIYLLYDLWKNEKSKKIYWLPILTIVWANVHGGSSNLSYLFCLVFAFFGLFKFSFIKIEAKKISKKQLLKYLLVAALCIIVIPLNPHGFKMLSYPYLNIADSTMVNFITEWQPTTLNNTSNYIYFLLLIFICGVMLFSSKKIKLIDLALLGICTFLGLKSIRFWGYTYIIMSYVIFYYIPNRKPDRGTSQLFSVLGLVLMAIFIINYPNLKMEYEKRYISEDVLQKIKEERPQRLYNMYDYGGELIYNGISVFVDGRADLYSRKNLKDYEKISKLEDDYVKLINKYDFDYFLVDTSYPINTYLHYSDNYEEISSTDKMILYKKVQHVS